MNKLLLLLLFIGLSLNLSSQDTIKIRAAKPKLYQGVSTEIASWYLYFSNEVYYLCKLPNKRTKEAMDWFEKRKDSQNVYKGSLYEGKDTTLTLSKENNSSEKLKFYFHQGEGVIVLVSTTDGVKFKFNEV
ncbi:hypothetical protein SAMN05216474_3104 [Lishizhenia tianjinensis]|uniref:Lipocalin-like domain-containing protein n=1 Tax=Lishizhenia tianjinensis TaxID=477690 RepID=A0A1I7BUU0_9FLAO|nr:hypothetical protein [Lishizhenia tianjinensis]SFT90919.1 hypothetical protein SAMN05216474_3104 [Lishizhenia tianjinensis]